MIKIRKPVCFSEIGKKDNQEDYLYPEEANEKTRVFVLCDGMGGHDNGEVASMTAGNALGEYLSSCNYIDRDVFETGLSKAYDALDSIDSHSPKKPGTTMTCLCLNEDSYLVAHIGDSRIYHIRPSLFDPMTGRGGILYQSSDHSLVNDLLKAGELTEEEAENFPQKNVITRAMQPNLPKRYKADIFTFDDIEDGDYFFLCCDGILEQLSNEMLCNILADKKLDDKGKLEKIKSVCDGKTKDNYSCWLIPIDKVDLSSIDKKENKDIIKAETEVENNHVEHKLKVTEENALKHNNGKQRKILFEVPIPVLSKINRNKILISIASILIIVGIVIGGIFVYKHSSRPAVKPATEHEVKVKSKVIKKNTVKETVKEKEPFDVKKQRDKEPSTKDSNNNKRISDSKFI